MKHDCHASRASNPAELHRKMWKCKRCHALAFLKPSIAPFSLLDEARNHAPYYGARCYTNTHAHKRGFRLCASGNRRRTYLSRAPSEFQLAFSFMELCRSLSLYVAFSLGALCSARSLVQLTLVQFSLLR